MGYTVENNEVLQKITLAFKERSKTLVEMAEASEFFFKEGIEYDKKAAEKFLTPDTVEIFQILIKRFDQLQTFNQQAIEEVFKEVSSLKDMKLGKIAQPVRVSLTGSTASPGIYEVVEIMGKEKVIDRLKKAVEFIVS